MTERSLSFDDQTRLFTELKERAATVRRGL
jgi:hypothetical protein